MEFIWTMNSQGFHICNRDAASVRAVKEEPGIYEVHVFREGHLVGDKPLRASDFQTAKQLAEIELEKIQRLQSTV